MMEQSEREAYGIRKVSGIPGQAVVPAGRRLDLASFTRQRVLFGPLAIAGASVLFLALRPLLDKTHFALLYLPVVVLVASAGGMRAGLVSAFLAFLAWDFLFLPPYYTLAVSDPADWLSLAVFLLAALVMGLRTGRLREREEYALAREGETALLYRLSSHLAEQSALPAMAKVLMDDLVEVTGAPEAALLLDRNGKLETVYRTGAGAVSSPVCAETAQWVYEQAAALNLPAVCDLRRHSSARWPVSLRNRDGLPPDHPPDLFVPLQAAERFEGILHVAARVDGAPFAAHEEQVLLSIAHMAAAFVERELLSSAAAQADAIREAARLKTTLVSSVSHELKTPLASITAAITSMTESDIEWQPEAVRHELEAVGEDLDRLNSSIAELLDLSRLEAGAWEPRQEWWDLGEIIGTTLSKLTDAQRRRIVLNVPGDLPAIRVDYAQLARALQNLVENALAYTPSAAAVEIGAALTPDQVEVWVKDEGPGLSPLDRKNAFEKFYRGSAAAAVPSGTGLGLTITREIVHFQGGRIRVDDVQPHGACFVISLPRETEA